MRKWVLTDKDEREDWLGIVYHPTWTLQEHEQHPILQLVVVATKEVSVLML
jgi:hypothetical protein